LNGAASAGGDVEDPERRWEQLLNLLPDLHIGITSLELLTPH
jgi:hypothetical protein